MNDPQRFVLIEKALAFKDLRDSPPAFTSHQQVVQIPEV